MMIIRDTKLAWIISGTFELIEISFRHWYPNFWECWWDSLLMDLFGCNMFGIILGAYTIKYSGVSRINWVYTKPTNKQIVAPVCNDNVMFKFLKKFQPEVLTTFDW